jgi:hypothetical protein
VKGLVAETLGYQYTGVELRAAQVAANRSQAAKLGVTPVWVEGDSAGIHHLLCREKPFDLVFTSPPYYNLETYKGGDKDGSGLSTYPDFMKWLAGIYSQCVDRLRNGGFFVVKVGEVRDPKTRALLGFVPDHIKIATGLGLSFYTEAVLITTVGTLAIRVSNQFPKNRMLGRSHQNILVFYKGDSSKARFPGGYES